MNSFHISRIIKTACVLIAAILISAVRPAFADESPLHLNVSVVKDHIMQGEPLLLRYRLTNQSTEPVTFKVGSPQQNWFRVSARDTQGRTASPVVDHRPLSHWRREGVSSGSYRTLYPGRFSEDTIIVNHYADIATVGEIQITFKANLTYEHGINLSMNAPDGALVMTRNFRVVSEPATFDALLQKAQHLRQRLSDQQSALQWPVLTKMLFAMPEEVALPVWRDLISGPKARADVDHDVIAQLVRLGTKTSIMLLDEMRSSNVYPYDIRLSARFGIEDLYQAGSPEMRAYLEQVDTARYGRVSETFQSIRQDEAKLTQRQKQSQSPQD